MNKRALLILASAFLLASCGGEGTPGDNPSSSSVSEVKRYTVTFANTDMPSVEIEEGAALTRPQDPSKANSLFVGWYLDASFAKEASFPLVIEKDTTLYANFYSYQEAFSKARANTIGEGVPGYEYDYTLDVKATYLGVGLTGKTTGKSQYAKDASEVTFYDAHVNSGALFYDGSKYQIKRGRDLHKISLDENDNVKSYDIEEVGEEYRYDSSAYAKAIFEYEDEKLKSISPTGNPGEYKLDVAFNPSQAIALVGNYLNHPMIEKLLGSLPETSVDTGMVVSFDGDSLDTYRYTMEINVADLQFSLVYSLTFQNQGKAPNIVPVELQGLSITSQDVANAKDEILASLDAYRSLESSSYDFLAKTAVGFAGKNDINATVDGFAKRKIVDGVVYYLNDYEVDTDLKNADLYKDKGLGDCHGGRAKLLNGETHDLKKKTFGGYSDLGMIKESQEDAFYLLDFLSPLSKVTFVQEKTASGKTTYAIGTTNQGGEEVLSAFNDLLRVNPLGECSVPVTPLGSFVAGSVSLKEFDFQIVLAGNALSEISLSLNGTFTTSYPGSRDFTTTQEASFAVDYSLSVTSDGASFAPASSVDKVK